MTAVELTPVTEAVLQDCLAVRIRADQESFTAPVRQSIDEAAVDDEYEPLAVCSHGVVVGFLLLCRHVADGSPWFGSNFWISRLSIDERWQGHGLGRAAVQAAVARLAEDPGCTEVWLGYAPENVVAAALYRSLGFVEVEPAPWGETAARLRLPHGSPTGDPNGP